MRINKEHLKIILPILSVIKCNLCEIKTNSFGEINIICSNGIYGKIKKNEFLNTVGYIGEHNFLIKKNSLQEQNLFINSYPIIYQESYEKGFHTNFLNNKISFKEDALGDFFGYINDLKFFTRNKTTGISYIEFVVD